MVGYYKNAPKEDKVLLDEIVGIIQAYYGDGAEPFLAELVLTKAREAVEGAGLTQEDIQEALNKMLSVPDKHLPTAYQVISEAATKAALKALGVNDDWAI